MYYTVVHVRLQFYTDISHIIHVVGPATPALGGPRMAGCAGRGPAALAIGRRPAAAAPAPTPRGPGSRIKPWLAVNEVVR